MEVEMQTSDSCGGLTVPENTDLNHGTVRVRFTIVWVHIE